MMDFCVVFNELLQYINCFQSINLSATLKSSFDQIYQGFRGVLNEVVWDLSA